MSNSKKTKSKLQAMLNKSITESPKKRFSQDSPNRYRSKQYEELQRLKSICFPKPLKEQSSLNQSVSKHERSTSYIPSRDRDCSMEQPSHQRNSSFFVESNSLLPPTRPKQRQSNLSFNMSSVEKEQESLSEIEFDSFDRLSRSLSKNASRSLSHSQSRSRSPPPKRDTQNEIKAKTFEIKPRKAYLLTAGSKNDMPSTTFSNCVEYYIDEISEFVKMLISSLKEVCLTKMSEKSLNLLIKKYSMKMDQLREQWLEQSKLDNDFSGIMKGLLSTLNSCFEEVGSKFSELLQKLKNFNSGHFKTLATKGAFTTLSLVLQENHNLNLQSIILQIHEALVHFKFTAASMRLSNVFKARTIGNNIHAFYKVRQFAQSSSSTSPSARLLLAVTKTNHLLASAANRQRHRAFLKWNIFSSRLGNFIETANQNAYKNLLSNLIGSVSNEQKFFETLNLAISAITQSKNCEFLIINRAQNCLYGYPNPFTVQANQSRASVENPFQKNIYSSVDSMSQVGQTNVSIDFSSINEDTHSRGEISLQSDSFVKYSVNTKEIICSESHPHYALYNKCIDLPLPLKPANLYHKSKIPRLCYFPVCNEEKEVIGIIRVFPDDEEVVDSRIIESLVRFNEFFLPFLDKLCRLKKRFDGQQQYVTKRGNQKPGNLKAEESNVKIFLTSALRVLHGVDLKQLLQETATLLLDFISADVFDLYSFSQEGHFVRAFRESNEKADRIAENYKDQRVPTVTEEIFRKIIRSGNKRPLVIKKESGHECCIFPVQAPFNGDIVAFVELEKRCEKDLEASRQETLGKEHNRAHQSSLEVSPSPEAAFFLQKYALNSIPDVLLDFIPSFIAAVLLRMQEQGRSQNCASPVKKLQSQLVECQSLNEDLSHKVAFFENVNKFQFKLRNSGSFEDIVSIFNETVTNTQECCPEFGAIFFAHPHSSSFFTFNFLQGGYGSNNPIITNAGPNESSFVNSESAVLIARNEGLLGKLFDSITKEEFVRISGARDLFPKGISPQDVEREHFFLQFRFAKHENNSSEGFEMGSPVFVKRSAAPLREVLCCPVYINSKPLCFVVFGSNSSEPSSETQELFLREIARHMQMYFYEQTKYNDSICSLSRKLKKSKIKSSTAKAYQSVLMNYKRRPEYQLYQMHRNLQSFISFAEASYTHALSARVARILLFNSQLNSFYYYLEPGSLAFREYSHAIGRSISGLSLAKNQFFVFPSLKQDSKNLLHDANETEMSFRSSISKFEIIRQKNKTNGSLCLDVGNSKDFSNHYGMACNENEGLSSPSLESNGCEELSSGLLLTLEKHELFNSNIDGIPELVNQKDEDQKHKKANKIHSFLCYPLFDENELPLAVVQVFNKENETLFTKKDLLKLKALNESITPKLSLLVRDSSRVVSKKTKEAFTKLMNLSRFEDDRLQRFFLHNWRMQSIRMKLTAKNRKSLIGGVKILAQIANQRLHSGFHCLRINQYTNLLLQEQESRILSRKSEAEENAMYLKLLFGTKLKQTLKEKEIRQSFRRWKESCQESSRSERDCRTKALFLKTILEKMKKRTLQRHFNTITSSASSRTYLRSDQSSLRLPLCSCGINKLKELYLKRMKAGLKELQHLLKVKPSVVELAQELQLELQAGKSSFKAILTRLAELVAKNLPRGCVITTGIINPMTENAILFSNKTSEGMAFVKQNKKVMRIVDTVVEQGFIISKDGKSLFSTDSLNLQCTAWSAIDTTGKLGHFHSQIIFFEIQANTTIKPFVSVEIKEFCVTMLLLFYKRLSANFSSLLRSQKVLETHAARRVIHHWQRQIVAIKNAHILNQTTAEFQNVEKQMVSLENNMKQYHQEISAYDKKTQSLTKALLEKTEEQSKLRNKYEKAALEKKAKTKCLSASLLLCLSQNMEIGKKSLSSAFLTWKTACRSKGKPKAAGGDIYQHTQHLHARYRSAVSLISLNLRRQKKSSLNDAFKRLVFYSTSFTKRNKQHDLQDQFAGYLPSTNLLIEDHSRTLPDEPWSQKTQNPQRAAKSQKTFQFSTYSQNIKENISPIDGQYSSEKYETEPSQSDRILQDSQRINLLHLGNKVVPRDQKTTVTKTGSQTDQYVLYSQQKSSSFNGPKLMDADHSYSSSNLHQSAISQMGNERINPRIDACSKQEEISERRSRILSEKTKQFLQNFDMDQYMDKVRRKTKKADGLNKSEIMLHENLESADFDKANNSVNLGFNFNNTRMFK